MFLTILIICFSLAAPVFLVAGTTDTTQLSEAEEAELCAEYAEGYEDANRELAWIEANHDLFDNSVYRAIMRQTAASNWRLEKLVMLEHMRAIGCDTSGLYSGPWAYFMSMIACKFEIMSGNRASEKCNYRQWEPDANLREGEGAD